MGKVIKVDFKKNQMIEQQTVLEFERILQKFHQKQRYRTVMSITAFSFLMIFVMLIPLIIDSLIRVTR